jgi:hypothetical protein
MAFSAWNRQQGVRLNVRGRDPHGIVEPGADYERLRKEIQIALMEMAEPRTGQSVIDQVWRREELYEGPLFEQMPDLAFSLHPNFAANPVQQKQWDPTGWTSGDHSLEGMFIAWGRGVTPGRVGGAELIDVAPTTLYLLDQPVPVSMDGKVLVEALDEALMAANPVRRESGGSTLARAGGGEGRYSHYGPAKEPEQDILTPEETLSPEEEEDLQDRLRGLGYL